MTWTAAIIVSARRADLVFDEILPAVIGTTPDQLLVVGDFTPSYPRVVTMRYLHVPPLAKNTNDALVKRDCAALACTSDWIAYFCDDHKPAEDFGAQIRKLNPHLDGCDVYVPARYAGQPGEHYGERLNNGEDTEYLSIMGEEPIGHYCGGHAGVYRLDLIKRLPWTAGPHHREWDLLNSRRHMDAGARYCWTDQLKVWDCEPGATPWL